jgi:hypothetical protein
MVRAVSTAARAASTALVALRKAGLWVNIMFSKSGKLSFTDSAHAKFPKVAEIHSSRAVSCCFGCDVKRITFVQILQIDTALS